MNMFNNFKATLHKLTGLPWTDFRNLFTWPHGGSTLQADNPNLLIAKATNENGEVVVYCAAENLVLVDSYIFAPKSTPSEAMQGGDSIDKVLAQYAGAQRVWIVIPNNALRMPGEKIVRVYERKMSQPLTVQPNVEHLMQQPLATNFIN